MTAQSDSILTALQQIRAQGAAEVVPHLAPLIEAVAAWSSTRSVTPPPAGLAVKVSRLAELAVDAGDAESAVALAGLCADLETLAVPAGRTAAGAAAETTKSPLVSGASLALRYPLPLLLGLVAAGAVSYGVHVAAQARFPLGSLTGWLLSASTTLLALALSLRVGALLAQRLPLQRLLQVSAAAATLAVVLAGTSYVVHRPGSQAATSPQPLAGSTLSSAPAVAPVGGAATGTPDGADADEAGVIALWWLGSGPVGGREPALASPAPVAGTDRDLGPAIGGASGPQAAPESTPASAPASAPMTPPVATRDTTVGTPADRSAAPPATGSAGAGEAYTELLDQPVRLIDLRGEAHDGTLSGISKEGVTLLTQVMMFGEPIQAHRQFRHGSIRSVRPR